MLDGTKSLGVLLLAAAVAWHLLAVLSPAWVVAFDTDHARDFGSYYYAVRVAAEGGDPYDKPTVNAAARADGRKGVHPFLYAPPFLLGMWWVRGIGLDTAYYVWFWLHEAMGIATGLVLWRWWRPLGHEVAWIVALAIALMTAIPNNHSMGQANFPGLVLALAALWQTDRGRPEVGGVLMGLACMLKMSPALFVLLWIARQQWVAAGVAVLTGVLLSVLVLPIAPLPVQWRFYTEVLPTFSSGWYNGLAVPIALFGNHSIPSVLHDFFPSAGHTLSPAAQALSTVTSLALLGVALWTFRVREESGRDLLVRGAQAANLGIVLLLVPVYTYEHHLVFAVPAAVISVVGVLRERLSKRWVVPVGMCVATLLLDLQDLKAWSEGVPEGLWLFARFLRELKLFALLGLFAATLALGRPRTED